MTADAETCKELYKEKFDKQRNDLFCDRPLKEEQGYVNCMVLELCFSRKIIVWHRTWICIYYFKGDGGSGLIIYQTVIGVFSGHNRKCGTDPDEFISVYEHLPWIKMILDGKTPPKTDPIVDPEKFFDQSSAGAQYRYALVG